MQAHFKNFVLLIMYDIKVKEKKTHISVRFMPATFVISYLRIDF